MNLLHVNDRAGEYPPSHYAATRTDFAPWPPLQGEVRADVCVVGAGYTGLSAALHLAQKGLSVVVLEAHRVGFGASGRNGGQLGSGQRQDQITLEKMVFPEPVISQAVEPKTKADQEKMGIALGRLAQEDPSFRVRTDEESGQTIISGMGELHLEIIVDRMKREFGVEANVGKPQVAYRETIRKPVEDVEGKFVRQSGGKGQYGHVVLKIEPQEPGKGFEFVDAIKGGVVPREFIPAVKKGIEDTLPNGVLAGYPVVDVKVTLTFGSYHEVDSNENAFKMAASMGFKDGCRKASPVILEPMMAVEVETPEDYAGSVMGDLSSRRGMVQGMDDMPGGGKIIKAEVPLSEMFGYSTTLRSMSQGRATYTMEFKHYSEAPKNVADAIITSRGK